MKTGKTKNRIREGNPAVTVLLYVLVLLICIATVYPMYYVLILSISAPEYAAKMNVYLARKGFRWMRIKCWPETGKCGERI